MRRPPLRQQGVAIITALLLTTLAVTIVASLFWQQQVQVRSMENQRLHLQTKWILRGALDWARLVLRQDGFDNSQYTTLTAVWNTPLAETRLDQYIERERVEGEVFDATLSGRIIDACSRYNLANLSIGRQMQPAQVRVYRRLLVALQIDPVLAERTAKAVASSAPPPPVPLPGAGAGGGAGAGDANPTGPGDANPTGTGQVSPAGSGGTPATTVAASGTEAPIALERLEDLLSIPGYTQQIVDKLRDFVIVLPEQTKVNVNTAPPEVLAALVEGMSVSEANALVARRTQAYWRQESDFKAQLFGKEAADGTYDVKSTYFLVLSRIRLDRAALDAEALVNRKLGPGAQTTTVWVRQL